MKVLMINKFLYPKGGSETYMLQIGAALQAQGHMVQYFGMEDEKRCVGNAVGAYTSNMDLHTADPFSRLVYSVKTVYSAEARRKLRQVLEDFQPDVCHLNNFHYQLTPAILLELRKWRKAGHACRVLYTAHDFQLVCPNHMCRNETVCEKCLGGHYLHCAKGKCIHGSRAKSIIGTAEALLWKHTDVYDTIDTILCCSAFLKDKLDTDPRFAAKTVTLHNFAERTAQTAAPKKDYVLYFGRLSPEKGVETLAQACRALPQISFVFAGEGPSSAAIEAIPNIRSVGFQTGEALQTLIREARFSLCPSECYENCPFSVLESLASGTPVLAAAVGGLPELVEDGKNGELFESGNVRALTEKIERLWSDKERTALYAQNCLQSPPMDVSAYTKRLLQLYTC